jgi:hypothetical protein
MKKVDPRSMLVRTPCALVSSIGKMRASSTADDITFIFIHIQLYGVPRDYSKMMV